MIGRIEFSYKLYGLDNGLYMALVCWENWIYIIVYIVSRTGFSQAFLEIRKQSGAWQTLILFSIRTDAHDNKWDFVNYKLLDLPRIKR